VKTLCYNKDQYHLIIMSCPLYLHSCLDCIKATG